MAAGRKCLGGADTDPSFLDPQSLEAYAVHLIPEILAGLSPGTTLVRCKPPYPYWFSFLPTSLPHPPTDVSWDHTSKENCFSIYNTSDAKWWKVFLLIPSNFQLTGHQLVFYNLIQFWYWLPGVHVRPYRLRTSSTRLPLLLRPVASHGSSGSPHFNLTWLQSQEFPQWSPTLVLIICWNGSKNSWNIYLLPISYKGYWWPSRWRVT